MATEYLPEGTLVPLTCKIVPLSNDDIVKKGSSDDDLISAGESFSLVNENRNVSPLFKFENLRNTVPFSSTKGYLLIIAVLLGAFISMSISMFIPSKSIDGSKIETRTLADGNKISIDTDSTKPAERQQGFFRKYFGGVVDFLISKLYFDNCY